MKISNETTSFAHSFAAETERVKPQNLYRTKVKKIPAKSAESGRLNAPLYRSREVALRSEEKESISTVFLVFCFH